jgi:4-amino-4-deoxy-L-arabinose transferase-like glycosyltransferase
MESEKDIVPPQKERIINWFKDKSNLTLILIIILAIVIRIYYFALTKGQAVWWDEAEYMNMARAWAFGLNYEFLPVRPIMLSLITAVFFKISYGELLPRIFIFMLSIASIYGMYLLGTEIYNKKVGLLISFLTSISYLHIFHTFRLLVDLPSFTFFVFGALFFYRYLKDNKNTKSLYIGAAIIAIGTLFRLTTATFLFVVLLYVLITERLNFLKKKEVWIAALIFVLILSPYILWGYLQFHGFVITQAGAWNAPKGSYISNGIWNFASYLSLFPNMFSWPLLIFLIAGLLLMYKIFIGFDILLKGRDQQGNQQIKRDLFLLLLFLIPILTVSFSMEHYFEDRYIFTSLPAAFIISSAFIFQIYNLIKKKNKLLAILFFILLLISITFIQLKYTDTLVRNKSESYLQVKYAGLWINQNSNSSDVIVTKSWPQMMYYSERDVLTIPSEKEGLKTLISSNPNIKFYVVSAFENHQEWMYSFPQENNLTIAQAYFADSSKQKPVLIIYKI